MSKIILFDLDGTLIDSTEAILASFDAAFLHFNQKKVEHSSVKKLIGLSLDVMFLKLGVNENEVNDYIKAYKAKYKELFLAQTTLLPFAKEALELASSFAKLGVVTTKSSDFSQILLKHLDVAHFFSCVVGRQDVKNPKPDKEPILKAVSYFTKPNLKQCFMIGDTHLDTQAAKNAGIRAVAVYSGYESKESLEKQNDFVKANVFEAVKFIKENF